jgi:hypothetical protein
LRSIVNSVSLQKDCCIDLDQIRTREWHPHRRFNPPCEPSSQVRLATESLPSPWSSTSCSVNTRRGVHFRPNSRIGPVLPAPRSVQGEDRRQTGWCWSRPPCSAPWCSVCCGRAAPG